MNEVPINSDNEKQVIEQILEIWKIQFPNPKTGLVHHSAFELLIATILSAKCTDKQVNSVTPKLFEEYPTSEFLSIAESYDIENIIKPVGFYKIKAKNIINAAKSLVENYKSEVPLTMKELLTLPGVGRKTANCVLSVYSKPEGIVVDTHVTRIANLLGIVNETKPDKIEAILMEIVAKKHWATFAHYMIKHGRNVCIARRPQCKICKINAFCSYYITKSLH